MDEGAFEHLSLSFFYSPPIMIPFLVQPMLRNPIKTLLCLFLCCGVHTPLEAGLSTNQLIYYFDFNQQNNPSQCIFGSGNVPRQSTSPISYTASNVIYSPTGGINNSGYIQTKNNPNNCLSIASSKGLPLTCDNFSISFNIRNAQAPGFALWIINGATVNTSWGIWGVAGGNSSWWDEQGNSTTIAPSLNNTSTWQSVIYSIKGKTATLFIDGKKRGVFIFNNNFANYPRLTLLGLGTSGVSDAGNNSVIADFDNIAIWGTAIQSEADARLLMTTRPDEIKSDNPEAPYVDVYHRTWNFNTLEDWRFYHQNADGDGNPNPEPKTVIENGQLKITVRPGVYDRRKASVSGNYTTGRYKWRIYLPKVEMYSRASFAAWIYCDDRHELDFEIASGTSANRSKYGAKDDELLALMTNQQNPFFSEMVPIKTGWHTVEMDLTLKGGNYFVQWIIDGKVIRQLQTQNNFGTAYKFAIHCSLENLTGMGDRYPTRPHTAIFDRVEYYYHP